MRIIQNNGSLLTKEELTTIFTNYELHEKQSFHVIEKDTKTYNTERVRGDFKQEWSYLGKKFNEGHTVIVRNMENFNDQIKAAAEELGPGTDVHLYLVPDTGGDSFDWHTDDRDVWVKMIHGEKLFILKSQANETVFSDFHKLKINDYLFIPVGQLHKAEPMGPSAMLSFGVLPNQVSS